VQGYFFARPGDHNAAQVLLSKERPEAPGPSNPSFVTA
jgi:hypothetical protein